MKNLQKLADECIAELEAVGITVKPTISWSVNTTAKQRWGQCETLISGDFYSISISQRLLRDDLEDFAAKQTIVHEILHAISGDCGHMGAWAVMAAKVNRLLPQYNITRLTSSEEKGIERDPADYKYVIRCSCCGQMYMRHRTCKLVERPEVYRCGSCHEKTLERVK